MLNFRRRQCMFDVTRTMVITFMLMISHLTWAEVATAVDTTDDVVVAAKILKDQQSSNKQEQQTAATKTDIQQPQIANDMAEGESIRGCLH